MEIKNKISFLRYEFISKKTDAALRPGETEPDENAFLVRCDARSFKTRTDFQEYITFLLDRRMETHQRRLEAGYSLF